MSKIPIAIVPYTCGKHGGMLRLCTAQVMPLRGAEEEDRGRAALRSLGVAMEQTSLLAPVSLELQGLSHFRHQATICIPAKRP